MKTIFMSIRPKHLCNILNFKKTFELRKIFPKDYRGWINCYCTKDKENLLFDTSWGKDDMRSYTFYCLYCRGKNKEDEQDVLLNGKVACRFWVDNVEEINSSLGNPKIYTQAYISDADAYKYGNGNIIKAIHISKLEIFDKPKELSDFGLTRAPQSWCYVEEE